MSRFQSCYCRYLTSYVELRRALGFKFETQAVLLRAFDQHVHELGYAGPLTQELALAFATEARCPHGPARRFEVVRLFAEYLATFEPQTPTFNRKVLPRSRAQPPPVILTDEQLAGLLDAARCLSPRAPLHSLTLYTLMGLAASAGLRHGEVTHLDKSDVDLKTGVLVVRQTKFHKDRLVPVHPTTLAALSHYAGVRDSFWPDCDCPAFFLNTRGRRFCSKSIEYAFSRAARQAGVYQVGSRKTTFHALRHGFAVRRLVAWYCAGLDVQALLPALATYMGHVHYSSTAYYLTATPELMALAAARSTPPSPVVT